MEELNRNLCLEEKKTGCILMYASVQVVKIYTQTQLVVVHQTSLCKGTHPRLNTGHRPYKQAGFTYHETLK